jgi:hypothetical protein
MFPAADISGQPAPGASTGDALNALEHLAKEILPTSFTTEWTEIVFQQKLAGDAGVYIFPLCVWADDRMVRTPCRRNGRRRFPISLRLGQIAGEFFFLTRVTLLLPDAGSQLDLIRIIRVRRAT